MLDPVTMALLTQAVDRQSPDAIGSRVIISEVTSRDLHPTLGSRAILQGAALGNDGEGILVSLNDVAGRPVFMWGVDAFGWGIGVWQP